jgi:microcystin-dependent protein
MADQFVAEIRIFPFNFAPVSWAFCDGQLMPISQNTALFSLVGTFYGGDGRSNFALPNLQGSAPMDQGTGPGLTPRVVGETGGTASVSLMHTQLQSQLPQHAHGMAADLIDAADTNIPGPNASYAQSTGGTLYQSTTDGQLDGSALGVTGGGLPHNNMQPYLTLNFCIALQGLFPARP